MTCSRIIFAIWFCLCVIWPLRASHDAVNDSLIAVLDRVIADRGIYLAAKEARLDSLRLNYETQHDDHSRFNALVNLYDEYHSFNSDSAYAIARRMEVLARKTGDPVLMAHARLKVANIMSGTGMYVETLGVLDSVHADSLPAYLYPYYYHIKRTIYGSLEDYAAFDAEKKRYHDITNIYRDSIMAANEPGSMGHVITQADYFNVNGDPQAAIDLLEGYMATHGLGEHDRAILAWTLSWSYARTGNRAAYKEQLLRSAISDLKSSVREYVSLRELAVLFYEEGDLDRAYRLITIAVDDAAKCNARQRIIELNDTYPKINSIYIEAVNSKKKALEITILAITVLSALLLVLLFYMRRQMQVITLARKELEDALEKQNRLTSELTGANAMLTVANDSIAEISELKEVYIGRYMDQCLAYIEKLDYYGKNVSKLVAGGNLDRLKKFLKSAPVIDDELKQFYTRFDRTFLNLFPTFVDDLNNLLLPGEELHLKKDGSMSAELRIYALIRLGITDSDSIAKFLRYSLTTIYNYRTKVRNKARGDRNSLEAQVMLIGRRQGNENQ